MIQIPAHIQTPYKALLVKKAILKRYHFHSLLSKTAFSPRRHRGHREKFLFVGSYRQTKIFCPETLTRWAIMDKIFYRSQISGDRALKNKSIINLIWEVYPPSAAPEATRVLFVYRYLPIDEKKRSPSLCPLWLCGEPDFKRDQSSPKTSMKSRWLALNSFYVGQQWFSLYKMGEILFGFLSKM